MKILCVIDMQNDFIDGTLGSPEAQAIVPYVCEKIKNFDDINDIICTFDTHYQDYLTTLEGEKLPIEHCKFLTKGWELNSEIDNVIKAKNIINVSLYKHTFGAISELPQKISSIAIIEEKTLDNIEIEICGLCTDICVVSNALILRAAFPNMKITCDAKACAGTSIEAHKAALTVMKSCQIDVYNED